MRIRAGFHIAFECTAPTPMLFLLHVHPDRARDLVETERFSLSPEIEQSRYIDSFGNICTRLVAPVGRLTLRNDFLIADSGEPEPVPHDAPQLAVQDLPDEAMVFLMGSRYCETQKLMATAWSLFDTVAPGWPRVEAILRYAHERIRFNYKHARADRTAFEAHEEQVGVCRDFAHLAITLCRCMNIPARYCTGYLGDIGVPPDPAPMDFSAWCEVYLGGSWYSVDARHFNPRIGRILIARGRDASDVAISTAFGKAELALFQVVTLEEAENPLVT
jgi:transglutaminase-like putative cysteine protease